MRTSGGHVLNMKCDRALVRILMGPEMRYQFDEIFYMTWKILMFFGSDHQGSDQHDTRDIFLLFHYNQSKECGHFYTDTMVEIWVFRGTQGTPKIFSILQLI